MMSMVRWTRRAVCGVAVLACVACANGEAAEPRVPVAVEDDRTGWSAYGGDAGGTRYSALDAVDRSNVEALQIAWTYRTGEMEHDRGESETPSEGCAQCHTGDTKFEATPVLADGRLYIGTPMNRIIAIDPGTGTELWRFDPEVKVGIDRGEGFISRGASYWEDPEDPGGACGRRVFMGTIDAELLGVDAVTGEPCADFGRGGRVRLDVGVGRVQEGQYGVTSPPAIVGDVVVIGSAIGDNRRVDMEHGIVRGYHAVTGDLLWSFDPIPRSPEHPAWNEWTPEAARKTGAANAWAPISADPERDMVFVPTGSAAPDFYGGERPGSNLFANSVVALRASTGEVVWYYQVVHHDVWDYDVASQPSLIEVPKDGRRIPAVAVPTKMGLTFLLDRDTGEPLYPVEQRPVPQSDVPGEVLSPTQPFPTFPDPVHPQSFSEDDIFRTPETETYCLEQLRGFRNEGIYTPPSVQGSLLYPGNGGGANWGSAAWDPERELLVMPVIRTPFWVKLHPREEGADWGNQRGTPYSMSRAPFRAPNTWPCFAPPWGALVALDLESGKVLWEKSPGWVPDAAEIPGGREWGSVPIGGAIVTAGGLVFMAATMDSHLRAFDVETGDELWSHPLPAGGQATPMTYEWEGRQYVVIAAGGHPSAGGHFGDYVLAFALPE